MGAALVCAAIAASSAHAGFNGAPGRVAFASDRDGNDEIYVMNGDGTSPLRLTADAASDRQPAFSPDGSKIAFTTGRDGNDEIYVVAADGIGTPLRITNNAAADTEPDWTADGAALLFTSTRDGNREIYSVAISASGVVGTPVNLTANAAEDFAAEAAADGTSIFFTSNRDGHDELYVTSPAGGGGFRAAGAGTLSPASDAQSDPAPGAPIVAFTSNRDGNDELYTFAVPATQVRLTNNAASDRQPSYSPNATRIAFTSQRDGNNEIYVVNTDGTGATNLTSNAASDRDPDWGVSTGAAGGNTFGVVAWQACGYGLTQRCVIEFRVAPDGLAASLGIPPAGIRANVFEASGFVQLQAQSSGADPYELLGGSITTNSLFRVVVNTGSIDPAVMNATGEVVTWAAGGSAPGGRTATLELRPRGTSWIQPACPDINCGTDTTQATTDYRAMAIAATGEFPLPDPGLPASVQAQLNAWRTAARGLWISTDAQVFGGPDYDVSTGAFSITAAAPHLMQSGALNSGFLQAFIPNGLLTHWGLAPAAVAGSSFTIAQTKGGVTTSMSFTFSAATGGVKLTLPEGSFGYSRPRFAFDAAAPPAASPPAPPPAIAPAFADLSVAVEGATTATIGEQVVVTATVTNAGSRSASGVALAFELPGGFRYVGATPSQGSCFGGVGAPTCALGELPAGAAATVRLTVEAERAGTHAVEVFVSSGSGDPNGHNDRQTFTTTVAAATEPAAPTAAVAPPAAPPPVAVAPPPPAAPQPPAAAPAKVESPKATKPKREKAKKKVKPKKKSNPKAKREAKGETAKNEAGER